jgi:spermidine synthase
MLTYVIYIIFFLSGASALIFESIWFRSAGLIFGNSVWSAVLVLSGFMAGLALGNFLIARYGHKVKSPVVSYSVLELVIGLTGMCLVLFFPFFESILKPVFRSFLDTPLVLNSLRFGVAFLLILIPTTAMGVTLPVLVKALSSREDTFGLVLGRLYGWNTIGAVAGALANELFLIKALGVRGAGMTAVSFNFLAACLAFGLSKHPHLKTTFFLSSENIPASAEPLSGKGRRFLLAAFFAGGILLALEVVWFRFLLLTRSGTSLIFSIMLSTVLAGIGTGGLLSSWLFSAGPGVHRYVRTAFLISGIGTIAAYWGFDRVFQSMPATSGSISLQSFISVSVFLMLPVSVVSGVIFPLLGQAVRENYRSETGAAGVLTLSNTLGAMFGSIFAGFFLLPHAGMERSFFILAAAYGIAAFLVPPSGFQDDKKPRMLSYAAGAVLLVMLLMFPFGMMENTYFNIVAKKIAREKRVAVRETLAETIFYYRRDIMDEPFYYRLVTNGFSMSATSIEAKRYMKLFVYLPVALHPDVKHALLISYGVGSTAKALTDSKGIERIDIVDISRDILEMSSIVYPDPRDNPLYDKRVRVHIEDGRFFLGQTVQKFDLITAEPPPPRIAGVVNLYTQEYFALIYDRLSEGGMTSYWLPVHSLNDEDTKSIIKAFCNVFADCSLWAGSGLDWVLLGSRNAAGPVSPGLFSRQWNDPLVGPELKEVGFENPGQMGSVFMAAPEDLKELTRNTLPLTDNYPLRLSDRSKPGKTLSPLYAQLMDEKGAMERFRKSTSMQRVWPGPLVGESLLYFRFETPIKNLLASEYRSKEDYEWDALHSVLTRTSLKTIPLWMMGTTRRELEIAADKVGDKRYASDVELLFTLQEISERNYTAAIQHFEKYFEAAPKDKSVQKYPLYLFALCLAGQTEKAGQIAEMVAPLLGDGEDSRTFLRWLNMRFGVRFPKN